MRSLRYSYVAACMEEMPGKNISVFTTVKREKFSCKSQTNYFKANRVFTFTAESFIHHYQAINTFNFLKVCFKCSVFENRKRVLLSKFVNKILRGREAFLQLKEARHFETCEGNQILLTDYFIHSCPWFQWNPTKQNRKRLRRLARQQWNLSHDDQAFLSQFYWSLPWS